VLVLLTRVRRALQKRPLTPRRAARVIAASSLSLTIAGGVVAWAIDRRDFESLGEALWWAVQTVTTVGYGDVVPTTGFGRTVAGILMISGIAFLAVVTASVTAALVEAARGQISARAPELPPELAKEIAARLAALEARFDKLEAALRSDRD
jgi:voltage-gated potassium channel